MTLSSRNREDSINEGEEEIEGEEEEEEAGVDEEEGEDNRDLLLKLTTRITSQICTTD